MQDVMYRLPWSMVLVMINDRTRIKKKDKASENSPQEITSQEEAMKFFNLK